MKNSLLSILVNLYSLIHFYLSSLIKMSSSSQNWFRVIQCVCVLCECCKGGGAPECLMQPIV